MCTVGEVYCVLCGTILLWRHTVYCVGDQCTPSYCQLSLLQCQCDLHASNVISSQHAHAKPSAWVLLLTHVPLLCAFLRSLVCVCVCVCVCACDTGAVKAPLVLSNELRVCASTHTYTQTHTHTHTQTQTQTHTHTHLHSQAAAHMDDTRLYGQGQQER